MRRSASLVLASLGLLAACKDDENGTPLPAPAPPPASYTVGGTVSGLSGSVTLANNGVDTRTLTADGPFTFTTAIAGGGAYAVTVTTQPAAQTCTVTSGAGNVGAANVTNVAVSCVTNTFTVGGTVSGLAGSGLVLQNNGGDNLAKNVDGTFTFATPVASGGAYNVTVATQPTSPAQTCTASSNAGIVSATVANVAINCVTHFITLGQADIGPAGGTVEGEYGAQIVVPPGALASTVTIGLRRDSSNSPAFAVDGMDAVGAIWELTPHGQAFTMPVTVRIPFDAEQVSNDADPALSKAEVGGSFASLSTTVNGGFLEAQVTGFSWVLPSAAANKPRMVYVIHNDNGQYTVGSHRINRTSGALSGFTSAAQVGESPTATVAHPSGRFLFITHAGSNTVNNIPGWSVATYRLNTVNGNLPGTAASTAATRAIGGYRPTTPVVHPSGKFLYVINFGAVTSNGGGDIDIFSINGATGALALSNSTVSGNGAQPTGIVFDRLGTRAWVLYAGSFSGNPLSSVIARYDVNLTTGAFTGPVSTTPAGVLGATQTAIAIDTNGRSLHVSCLSTNEVISFAINASTGALTNLGSLPVQNRAAAMAADPFGRFIYAGKSNPLLNVNVLSYVMNASTGALTLANSQLTACPAGNCSGDINLLADPQGNFLYGVDNGGGLSAFAVNPVSGVLTSAGAAPVGSTGPAVSTPFAATGVSPVWQNNCTQGCAMAGMVTTSGGGNPPSNPSPPTAHFLSVSAGAFFGSISSSPGGINYSPPTNGNPTGNNDISASFPAGSSVQLCSTPPPQPAGSYNITWMGSCSGTSLCTNVTMTSDKTCHADFQPRLP